jgi:hypothetical protein
MKYDSVLEMYGRFVLQKVINLNKIHVSTQRQNRGISRIHEFRHIPPVSTFAAV